ncbi:MAG: hypothetical protein HY399_02420, partial [Elusimicrobia bacterium]|nr:hypothetical protein [Elusimicrobiota bacterium]
MSRKRLHFYGHFTDTFFTVFLPFFQEVLIFMSYPISMKKNKLHASILTVFLTLLALAMSASLAAAISKIPTDGEAGGGDTTPPTGTIGSPVDRSSVAGDVNVLLNVTDNVGVAGVQFQVDGVNVGPEISASDQTSFTAIAPWDTTCLSKGDHTLSAVVRDTSGNISTLTSVVVTAVPLPQNAFRGDYFNNQVVRDNPGDIACSTCSLETPAIDFTWPSFPIPGISDPSNFSVKWEGLFTLPGGDTPFITTADYGVRLFASRCTDADNCDPYSFLIDCWDPINVPNPLCSGSRPTSSQYTWPQLQAGLWRIKMLYRSLNPAPQGPIARLSWALPAPTDTTPPSVSIINPSEGALMAGSGTGLSVTYSDDVGVVGIQWKVDETNLGSEISVTPVLNSPRTISIPFNTNSFSDGPHTLTAVARDAADNTTTSAPVNVTIDNTPPAISGVGASGISQNSATISWTTDEPSNSQVEYGISTSYGSATAVISTRVTSHSQTLSGLAGFTLYHFRVKSRDAVGNLRISGDGTFTTLDTTPPSVPAGLSASAVSCSQINLAWNSSSDTGGSGLKGYNLFRNNVFLTQVLTPGLSASDTGLSPSTNYSYAISAIDNAGNESLQSSPVSAATPACPDTTPPTIAILSPANGANIFGLFTISGTAADNVGVVSVKIQVDGGPSQTATGTNSWSRFLSLSDGNHTLTATAWDASGNPTTSNPIIITVDNTPPTIAILSPANGANISGPFTISGTAADNVGVTLVELAVDGGAFSPASYTSPNWSFSQGALSFGSHSITARAKDAVGLIGSASISITVPDTTPPSVPAGLSASASSCSQIDLAWNSSSDTGGSGLKGYNLFRNNVFLTQVLTPGLSASDTGLAASTSYSYSVSAVDNAGNESSQSSPVNAATPACDNSPTIRILSPANGATVSGNFTISGTASDDIGVADMYIQVDGADQVYLPRTPIPGTISWTANLSIPSDGLHTLTANAQDTAGQWGSHDIGVTVSNPFNFSLSNAGTKSITGTSVINTITATRQSGTAQPVTFSVANLTDLPAGIGASFNVASCTPSTTCSTILTLTNIPPGVYTITVTGTAGSVTRTTSFTVTFIAPPSGTCGYLSKAAFGVDNVGVSGSIKIGGDVWSQRLISASGGALIDGNAYSPFWSGSSSNFTSGKSWIYFNPAMPNPGFDLAAAFAYAQSTNNNASIPSDYLSAGALVLSSGQSLTLSQGIYYLRGITLSGQSTLSVGSGQVTIYLDGPLSITGGSASFIRTGTIGTAWIYVNGAQTLTDSGNSESYYNLFAPNSSLSITGTSKVYGCVLANAVTVSGRAVQSSVPSDPPMPRVGGASIEPPIKEDTPLVTLTNSGGLKSKGGRALMVSPSQYDQQLVFSQEVTKVNVVDLNGRSVIE